MEKISQAVILSGLSILLAGCDLPFTPFEPPKPPTPQEIADSAEFPDGRFRLVKLPKDPPNMLIDGETGCRYLYRVQGGITPLLTKEGKPDCR